MDQVRQDGMGCAEFEAVMAEALDGQLTARRQASFEAHRAACPNCAPLFADALAGMQWMRSLPEAEPPANLLHNILVATTGVAEQEEEKAPQASWLERLKRRLPRPLVPVVSAVMQPRFAMSFGMAFFSVTLLLNLAGVRLSDIQAAELSPGSLASSVVETYNQTTARVVRYYENLRFVYEIETRVRDLREAAAPPPAEEPAATPGQEKPKDDSTRGPAERQQNYSRGAGNPNLAHNLESPAAGGNDRSWQGRNAS